MTVKFTTAALAELGTLPRPPISTAMGVLAESLSPLHWSSGPLSFEGFPALLSHTRRGEMGLYSSPVALTYPATSTITLVEEPEPLKMAISPVCETGTSTRLATVWPGKKFRLDATGRMDPAG